MTDRDAALFDCLLGLGDDRLVLGHVLSQWCGHGPVLEEDIACANIALDLIGQATLFLGMAGDVEGKGRDADALAYFRDAVDFRNHPLVELPRGDYAFTMVRQFLFSSFAFQVLGGLERSRHQELAGIAAKAAKETAYHLRHSSTWVRRLGDGTQESHTRMQFAVDSLWRFTAELTTGDDLDRRLAADGIGIDPGALAPRWTSTVHNVLHEATLTVPDDPFQRTGGRAGRHSEHLGFLLAELQIVPRSHPGLTW